MSEETKQSLVCILKKASKHRTSTMTKLISVLIRHWGREKVYEVVKLAFPEY